MEKLIKEFYLDLIIYTGNEDYIDNCLSKNGKIIQLGSISKNTGGSLVKIQDLRCEVIKLKVNKNPKI